MRTCWIHGWYIDLESVERQNRLKNQLLRYRRYRLELELRNFLDLVWARAMIAAHQTPTVSLRSDTAAEGCQPRLLLLITTCFPTENLLSSRYYCAVQLLREEMGMASCRIQSYWIYNTIVVLSVFGMLTLLHMNLVSFPKIGFYCNDPKIAHKFNGDTVTNGYLFAATLTVPIIMMALVEWCIVRTLGGFKQALRWYGQFVFGLLLLIFVVEAAKTIVSEPRPHFLDTCRPDKAINCTTGYVTDYICTNPDKSYRIKDSARSFPSGHSAIGFYFSVFLIMFLQHRIPDAKFLVVPWMQCLILIWGILCALTRITDRRHHWWDVLTGAVFGVVIAAYAVKRLCNDFCYSVNEESSSESSVGSGKNFASRRLLSSTSSYTPPDEKDVRALS